MWFSSFFRKDTRELVALVDIGPSSCGGAIVRYEEGKRPHILWIGERVEIKNSSSRDTVYKATANLLEEMSAECRIRGFSTPTHVSCALSPTFYSGKTECVQKRFDSPQEITQKLLDTLARDVIQEAGKDFVLIDEQITRVRLNGYTMKSPLGKKAAQIDLDFYWSAAPRTFVDMVRACIHSAFPRSTIELHTFSFLSFIILRDILHEEVEFISLTISPDTTTVSLVRAGRLISIFSYPFGQRMLVSLVAEELRTIPEESEVILRLYGENKVTDDIRARVRRACIPAETQWRKRLLEILEAASFQSSLPQKLFILGEAGQMALFKEFISGLDAAHLTLRTQPFSCQTIPLPVLAAYVDESPNALAKRDLFLLLESIAFSRIHAKKNI